MKTKIVIGTRGSQLSLIQTNIVKNLLRPLVPHNSIEIKIIKTTGDKNMNPIPLDSIGKGWFTKEIDRQLLEGNIDLAVHSFKDLPDTLPLGLTIAAIPEREDAREALVARNGLPLQKLKKGAVIGTDSTRRKIQLLKMRSDVVIKSIRGNVNRRLEKLDNEEYDAVCLAVAGLKRLGMTNRISHYFDETDFVPSPGQGALAIITKKSNKALNKIISQLNHQPSVAAVIAERIFSRLLGGGCKMPIGAYAHCVGSTMTLYGMVGSLDGKKIIKDSITGDIKNYSALSEKLANRFSPQAKYIVMTRPVLENDAFTKSLKKSGILFLSYPSITTSNNASEKMIEKYFTDKTDYDWLIFTSANGVRFFMDALQKADYEKKDLQKIAIAAVGPQTAKEVEKYNLDVSFIPSKFTTADLAKELPNITGKKLLLPRSNIASTALQKQLLARGATVTNIPIYKTEYASSDLTNFLSLIHNKQILCITFTSPSTVKGFIKNITDSKSQEKIFSVPVVSIGPVTTKALQKVGFKKIYTAEVHTIKGMLAKLK